MPRRWQDMPDRRWWEENTPTLLATARAARQAASHAWRALDRVLLRPVGRALGRPAVLGAAYLAALTLASVPATLVDRTERALGADTSKLEAWIRAHFGGTIAGFVGAAGLTAIVLGGSLGVLSGLAIRLRAWAAARPPPPRLTLLVASFAVTAAVHAALVVRAMASAPQLFTGAFYDRGGWRTSLQVLVTDRLGVRGADLVLAALVLGIAPPPWTWPFAARRLVAAIRARTDHPGRWAAAAACAFVAAALLVTPFPTRAARHEGRPNVLLLASDSFRHDALEPRVMPKLSAFAARGVRFSHAYVSMARTLTSWTTFLTGKDPHHHGIRSMFPRWEQRERGLDTLPARLARAGYRTQVVSDYVGDAFHTIDLGFQEVMAPRLDVGTILWSRGFDRTWPITALLRGHLARRVFPALREKRECASADLLADDAIGALDHLGREPFFLTVFFGASHAPYAAPAPYYRRFTDASYEGPDRYHKSRWIAADEKTTPASVAHVKGLYEGALASVDDAAARILDALARRGLAEDTLVVVMGDHGEDLADAPGRYYGHGNHLFGDHDLHIPLVVVDPRRRGGRVEPGVVTSADLAPTLHELLGVEGPRDVDGESLVPALDGAPIAPRPTFAETELWIGPQPDVPDALRLPYGDFIEYGEVDTAHGDTLVLKPDVDRLSVVARHRMVREGAWKLLYMPTLHGVVYQLFDTDRDPENLTDVAAEHPEVKARLQALLWSWMLRDPAMEERRGYLVPKGFRVPGVDGP